MLRHNPIAGGPDLILALRNALEKAPNAYAKPPVTGGTQISSRFADDRLTIIDAISLQSEWNRNQVINALVDRGLFELFQQVSDETMNTLMDQVVDKIMPTFDTSANTMRDLSIFNRFQILPALQATQPDGPAVSLDRTWLVRGFDRDAGVIELHDESAGWVLPLHLSHIAKFHRDTVSDARDGHRHCILELNVQVVASGNRLSLMPISAGKSGK